MAENVGNDFSTTLSAAITGTGDTSMTVTSSTGAPAANFRIRIDDELILVTAVAHPTWTITRGIEGTTAATHSNGAPVVHVITKGGLDAYVPQLVVGKMAVPIPVSAITPRSANGCASMATSNGAANQPDVPYLAFDGAAKEYAGFLLKMPKGWNESTVTASMSWRRASGTGAANVVWGIRAVAVSDNETPAVAFGSDATVTDAASTTAANFNLSAETGACTIGGTPAEGDLVFFEVFRDGAAGADTLDAVDAWLTEVTLFVTTNAPTDA